jgi:hypothetical protein
MKYKGTWTWENGTDGTAPEFGWISWISTTIENEEDGESFTFEAYVGYSLPEDFDREDLIPYEKFGLDADAFYRDWKEEDDFAYKPLLTDNKYHIDEKYEEWQLIEGFEEIFDQAYAENLTAEQMQALQAVFFRACKEVLLCQGF